MSAEIAAELVGRSTRTVAFTGAGMSTESGLPDFRSSGGLWGRWNPQEVATVRALRVAPERFYAFYRERLAALAKAQPNKGHYALAQLERWGVLDSLITQNVDSLHHQAGSQQVIELHGNLREAACIDCGVISSIDTITVALAHDAIPRCPHCRGLLKPNVVLFEELLPAAAYSEAKAACSRCDVMLVVGSSLQVTPAAWLPEMVQARGAAVIIINDEPTPFDPLARVVIRGRAATVLPTLARALDPAILQRDSFPPRRKQSSR
jgi:NAD-dependent deacetylase